VTERARRGREARYVDARRPVKVVLIICAASAIATLGLLEGGGELSEAVADHPLDEHFDPLMPRYPRVAEFPLGEQLGAGDSAMRMSYFSTKDPPLRVARYYRTLWEQQGLSVHHNVSPAGGIVGTFDPRIKAARSVTILSKGQLTWVFPATVERPLGTAEQGDLGEEEGLPVFPGSRRGLTLRTSDAGRGSLVTTYSNAGGLTKNVRFFRNEMSGRGWREERTPDFEELGEHQALTFERGGQRCIVNLTPIGDERQVVVSVILENDVR